jgi:catechol 2,3-dioxygenase-like lactoylglutathione lyase family enzyme
MDSTDSGKSLPAEPPQPRPISSDSEPPSTFIAAVFNVADLAAECDFYRRLGMQIVKGPDDEMPVIVKPGSPLFGTNPAMFILQATPGPVDHGGDDQRLLEVSDIDKAIEICQSAGLEFLAGEYEDTADYDMRYLKLRTPNGQALLLQRH